MGYYGNRSFEPSNPNPTSSIPSVPKPGTIKETEEEQEEAEEEQDKRKPEHMGSLPWK